jgi:hypothetical protein
MDEDGPAIALAAHFFDTRSALGAEEANNVAPAQGRPECQPEGDGPGVDRGLLELSSNGRRRTPIRFPEHGIEPSNTLEAGRKRHIRDREPCVGQEHLGELDPPRTRRRGRGRPHVLEKESTEVAWADPEGRGEIRDAPFVEDAVIDEAKRA